MKKIPYTHQYIDKSDIKAVAEVLKSDWITQGPMIKKFEERLASYCNAKYAVAVSNGTAALHLTCLAAGITKGDEVITSPLTFLASANCILYCSGKPVFADIQQDSVNIDPKEVKKKINKNTKAIIPVHFAGQPADMEEINRLAKRYGLLVVEDAAHALGAEYKGSKIGSGKYSDMTVFSFHPAKSITTGEGGAILTNRKDLYEKLLSLRNHGIIRKNVKLFGPWYYQMQYLGFNYRITDFQCALGISQLNKIDSFIKRRREIVSIYNKELSGISGITLPVERPYAKSSWHIYCIRLKAHSRRKDVFEKLQKAGIGVQVHYIPVYWHPYYKNTWGYKRGLCPMAEDYYKRVLTIPLFPKMTSLDISFVIRTIRKVMESI